MLKFKEFKTPTDNPVRVLSEDGNIISMVYPDWTMLREEVWRDAYANGCVSRDMSRLGVDPTESIANIKAQEIAFEENLERIMRELIEEGDPDKLDAVGRPLIPVLTRELGESPSAALRNSLFKKIKK